MKPWIPGVLGAVLLITHGCVFLSVAKKRCAAINRARLAGIETGMSQDQVFEIMGTASCDIAWSDLGLGESLMKNPYQTQVISLPSGQTLEIVDYLTFVVYEGQCVYLDECTPLIFEKGILVGWGNDDLARILGRDFVEERFLYKYADGLL